MLRLDQFHATNLQTLSWEKVHAFTLSLVFLMCSLVDIARSSGIPSRIIFVEWASDEVYFVQIDIQLSVGVADP